MTLTDVHRLGPSLLAALAGGNGGEAAIRALSEAQVSKRLLLVRYLLADWPGSSAERDAVATTLEAAQKQDAAAVSALFGAPMVGAWAVIASRARLRGVAAGRDIEQLAGVAAVAAATAGVEARLPVPVVDGRVTLPTLGTVTVDPGAATAEVVVSSGRVAVRVGATTVSVPAGGEPDPPGWQGVRTLTASAGGWSIRLDLDDLNPYRHGHHAPPADRVDPAEMVEWQAHLDDAWRLLTTHLPVRAAELRAGLRTLVPLVQPDRRTARSATIRHVFGAFGLTRPVSGADFAVTLVHEFQHSKLSAVLDQVRLLDPDDDRRYFAPWRADPRPLGGLVQGVYAFLGVAEAWRALRAEPDLRTAAEREFAESRLQVRHGLAAVEESGSLTPIGAEFVRGMRAALDELFAEPVPVEVVREAEADLRRTRQMWLDRNGAALPG